MSRGRNTESGAAQGARRATEAAPDSARRGKVRWSARRKVTVVLELMRGVELEATSRKYAVTAATLTSWRDAFLQRRRGGQSRTKGGGGRGEEDAEVRSDRSGDGGTCQQLWDTRELHLVSLDYGGETREVGAIDVNIDQDLVA